MKVDLPLDATYAVFTINEPGRVFVHKTSRPMRGSRKVCQRRSNFDNVFGR